MARGLTARLRVLKYEKDDRFDPHFDQILLDGRGQRSLVTVLVYLNDGFEGGETAFLNSHSVEDPPTLVAPETGATVLFEHVLVRAGQADGMVLRAPPSAPRPVLIHPTDPPTVSHRLSPRAGRPRRQVRDAHRHHV